MKRSEFVTLYYAFKVMSNTGNHVKHDPDFKHMIIRNLKSGLPEYETIEKVVKDELKTFIEERGNIELFYSVKDGGGNPIVKTVPVERGSVSVVINYFGVIQINSCKIQEEKQIEYYEKVKELENKYKENFDRMREYLDKEIKALPLVKVSHSVVPEEVDYQLYEVLLPVIIQGTMKN